MIALERLFVRISGFLGYVAIFFMGFLMLGTSVDVIFRSLRGSSISGVFEMAETSMVLVVFLGLGWTRLDNAHIRVDMLVKRMPGVAARISGVIAWGVAAALLLILAIPSTEEAMHSFAIREFRWGYIEFPIWWAKIILAVGLWFGFLQMALEAVRIALFGMPPVHAARNDKSGKHSGGTVHG